ncbi:hypothetical protein GPK74_02960 [Coprococcus catus]|uniref:DUF859 family phage minor structural protein n=1 Tax=Coprococcus catus TaxID=116085 RepID=UPI001C030C5B|nr:DUF859 family phage minor structural protein [Coprococcus catus]MBT9768933.1 hypothetical protein [Coprococcus catus]
MASTASSHVPCGYNGHYHLYMTITQNKRNASTNQSNVTVKMYAQSDSSSYGAYNLDASGNTVKMTVNGKQVVNKSMAMDFRNKATVQLASWTGAISHGSDGSKKLDCSGSFSISGSSYLSGGSISCSIQLESIPRATKPTLSASSVALGSAVTINISPAVSAWTHNIYYRIGTGDWVRFATGVKSNYSWTVPLGIASSYPTATKGTITIGLNTYNGSTQIGGTQTVNLNITIPASVAPSVSAVTVSEAASGLSNFGFVQTKSKLKIVASASGAYSSSIRSYVYNIGSQSYSGLENTYTMGEVVRDSGTVVVTVTVTDSRGRTASKTVSITVLAYSPPQITHFECSRCGDANGSANANGQYLKVTFGYSVSPLNNKNKASYLLKYSVYDDGKWGGLISGTQYTYSGTYISATAILNTASTYQIGLVVTDSFGTASFYKEIGTAVRLLSYIVKRFALAIGKIPEIDNMLDVALETIFRKKVTMNSDLQVNGNSGFSEGASFYGDAACNGTFYANGNLNANRDIGVGGNMWFNQNNGILFVTRNDGVQLEAINTCDGENNLSFGWTNYNEQRGDTYVGGKDVYFRVSGGASKVGYRPYYRRGDSIDVRMGTAGYVTSGTKEFYFAIPLGKPVVGNPTVSVSSINGLMMRQNSKYIIKADWVQPDRYSAYVRDNNAIGVIAFWNSATNAANNSPVGIDANIRITFS